jgi:hypothetical protein
MITEETVRTVASLLVLSHRLDAPRVAADIVMALEGDAELQQDWQRVARRVWRTLHRRR